MPFEPRQAAGENLSSASVAMSTSKAFLLPGPVAACAEDTGTLDSRSRCRKENRELRQKGQ